ncbi:helix-turn-helix domain-containing protein [Limnohabitans sp.]|jgi:excisionase family DNA binding protein|uniref:helix-turn-helix domain-containing protein n=1 Tax=Limnohabitans sp. TaxID=1907725 RepID=UPI00391A13B8
MNALTADHRVLQPESAIEPQLSPFLSTAEAAKMLGLSTTMVQSLMDSHVLKGWKTRGGHRRIALHSVLDYQQGTQQEHLVPGRRLPKVMVVSDDQEKLQGLLGDFRHWALPLPTSFFDSVTAALLEMTSNRPDMLVVELTMPLAQQEKILDALQNFSSRGMTPMSIVLVTRETGLHPPEQRPGKCAIQVVVGPLVSLWLHGFLTGVMTRCKPV